MQLSTNPAVDTSPAWSPDNSRIAFVTNRDSNNEIYTTTTQGSFSTALFRLTTDLGDDNSPLWSPDVLRIAFTSNRGGSNNVWSVNAYKQNNSGIYDTLQLSNGSLNNTGGIWSPDGSRIVYVSGTQVFVADNRGANGHGVSGSLVASDAAWLPISSAQISQTLLSDYGVIVAGTWTPTQLRQMLIGVQRVGEALAAQSTNATDTGPDAFKRILEPNAIQIKIEKSGTAQLSVGCVTVNSITPTRPTTITCGLDAIFTQYTAVHELGHVFDGRSAANSKKALNGYVMDTNATAFKDSKGRILMGRVLDPNGTTTYWTRGGHGFGSGPQYPNHYDADTVTPFEQDACREGDNKCPSLIQAVQEAAADLFLNWVYRKTGEETAFQDRSWLVGQKASISGITVMCDQTMAGCRDGTNPGQQLFEWTSGGVTQIFSDQGWN